MADRHTAHGYWIEEAGGLPQPLPALEGERSADVVVVGGGYTGMWTAWHLKQLEPNASVVLLEAEVCGEGPSGRNAGFVNTLWFSLPNLRRRFGDERAIAVARAAQAAADAIGDFCAAERVEAWFHRGGYMHVSTSPGWDGDWVEELRACAELGEPDAGCELTAADVAERCASPIFRGGVLYPGSATVQPARLAFGLRARLRERGVEIHEKSPVLGLERDGDAARVRTSRGTVRAGAAIVAAGGRALTFPGLRRRLTLTSSHLVLTEPVPDFLAEIGWTGGECITDSRAMIHYFRTTPDGRIAFGWGAGRVVYGARTRGRAEVDARVVGEVEAHLRRFFPGLAGRRVEHAWGGPIDVSPSHLPIAASLDGSIHYGFGYTGNGVGPSHMVARSLASLALDRRDDASRLAIVEPAARKVPPEPFRYLGGSIVRRALLRREDAIDRGRTPDPLTSFIAGIPERIGIHVGR
ncbi:MAG TPA: FAD-binding oxidoreductase [Solirubrobacterales bacterium]|nr:FAD-binding oxidoreductase [Solirubrobacterales bacterium]